MDFDIQNKTIPHFQQENRSATSFDFNQRISMSLMGKVGTRLNANINYDTQSTFSFQNLIKLEYTPTEDDIIKSVEVGNVNMPLNSSLIKGAQSLFGVKTKLQFGKTTITGVFSEQKISDQNCSGRGRRNDSKTSKCLHWIMTVTDTFSFRNILETITIELRKVSIYQ